MEDLQKDLLEGSQKQLLEDSKKQDLEDSQKQHFEKRRKKSRRNSKAKKDLLNLLEIIKDKGPEGACAALKKLLYESFNELVENFWDKFKQDFLQKYQKKLFQESQNDKR